MKDSRSDITVIAWSGSSGISLLKTQLREKKSKGLEPFKEDRAHRIGERCMGRLEPRLVRLRACGLLAFRRTV